MGVSALAPALQVTGRIDRRAERVKSGIFKVGGQPGDLIEEM